MGKEFVIAVGTYTHPLPHAPYGHADGVYMLKVDTNTGIICRVHNEAFKVGISPSYLAVARLKNECSWEYKTYLYAVKQVQAGIGGVNVLELMPDFSLVPVDKWEDERAMGCAYVATALNDTKLLIANYTAGNIFGFDISQEDGRLTPKYFEQYEGVSGVVLSRQQGPHAHCIVPDPQSNLILVADLGSDKIWIYKVRKEEPTLTPFPTLGEHFVTVPPGTGPRHLVYHPTQPLVLVSGELANTVLAFQLDRSGSTASEVLKLIQVISTLPEGYAEESTVGDIHTSVDGRFVYVTNRGHDSIAHLKIGTLGADGKLDILTFIDTYPTKGNTPRNFGITPDDKMLLAANQDTDTITAYWRDIETGVLTDLPNQAICPSPVCLRFLN